MTQGPQDPGGTPQWGTPQWDKPPAPSPEETRGGPTPSDPYAPPAGAPPYGGQQYGGQQYGGQPPYGHQPPYGGPAPYGVQPGYGVRPGYGYGPPMRNGLGTAALICGIAAIVLCWTVAGGVILGVLGIVFGFVTRGRVKRGEANNGGLALAGIITGAVGLALGIGFIAVYVAVARSPSVKTYIDCINDANGNSQQLQQCRDEFDQNLNG